MKKLSILAIFAMAMVSCGNTYTAKDAVLSNQTDSINYALGFVNGAMIKMQHLSEDSSDVVIAEFMDALQRGYDGKVEERSEVATVGRNIGMAIKASEKTGLADNKAWTLNEKIFFQGLVNGLYGDSVVMHPDTARNFFQAQYAASMGSEEKAGKFTKGKCPNKVKAIALNSLNDSLNYAFGILNGSEIKMYVLANDSTGEDTKTFLKEINNAMKLNVRNPQLMNMGEQIGKTIKEQESQGLLGEASLVTDFEMIKQGFVNGMKGHDTQFNQQAAGEYIQNTMNFIKYGNTKADGEQFLAENALKEGVKVTDSGLQYEVLKQGTGRKPTATDKVKVHYHGTLINGTVFDSSVERGEPITFALNGVIAGWTEGLQLMPVGSKYRFYIPQELGYGARAAGQIPPYSTLIFEVELLDIEK